MPQFIITVGIAAMIGGVFCALVPRPISKLMKDFVEPLVGKKFADVYSDRPVRVFGIIVAMVGAFFILTVIT